MKTFLPSLWMLSVCFLPLWVFGSGNAALADKPNILFLLSDDQRPDTISALGNNEINTPHLDWLVKNGTTMTRATCANPICTPSRAEMMTGANGFKCGVLDFGGKFKPEMKFWADSFKQAGYETCYVGKWHNGGRPSTRGYTTTRGLYRGGGGRWWKGGKDWAGREVTGYRGWVFQTDDGKMFPEKGVGLTAEISEQFAEATIGFLKEKREKPFFLHVNFTAPHDPLLLTKKYRAQYTPEKITLPKNFLSEHPFDHGNFDGRDEKLFAWPRTEKEVLTELAAYYAVIAHMDEQIGRILDTLREQKLLENTLIIFASDHGLGLGSHGLRGKQSMYEHTIGVPLIFSGPGIPKNQQSDSQCYLRDLFPTTCDYASLPIPETVTGKSLLPIIKGDKTLERTAVYGYFRNFQRMIRTDRFKLIWYPHLKRYQLFDLKADPHELTNLAGKSEYTKQQARLTEQLETWLKEQGDSLFEE